MTFNWERPELEQLRIAGYAWNDPTDVIDIFEKKVASFAGSKYAVAIDCCSHGVFLALKYLNANGIIDVPSHTYVSVPSQVVHAGCRVNFVNIEWSGVYQLAPYPIFDGAVRWTKNMYKSGLHILSFQIKKRIPIGKGGMILTDDIDAYNWLKCASHDGRTPGIPFIKDDIKMIGWHYNMTAEDAARGILLMDRTAEINDDSGSNLTYSDLSTLNIF